MPTPRASRRRHRVVWLWGVGGVAPTPRVVGLGEGLVVSVFSAVCAGV